MRTLSSIDLPARLEPAMPLWLGEIVTAVLCLTLAAIGRMAIDILTPHVAPFVLLFPAALIATLAGGWRAGALTFGLCEVWAWCYEIQPRGFAFKHQAQPAELLAIALAGVVMIGVAQAFRRGVRREADAGQAQLAERDLMLRELDHRMKNNLQTVAAVIELQRRRAADEAVRAALGEALARVASLSEAHRQLFAEDASLGAGGPVDMSVYLPGLCGNLADGLLLGELVRLDCEADAAPLSRERAVAIGLIVNELVTNAAKHAFAAGDPGRIRVAFGRGPRGYRLTVEDDGRGLPEDFATRRQGLGRGLVQAFTRQARGSLTVGEGPGARFEVDLAA